MASATENGHHRVNGRRTWGIVIGLTAAVVVLAAFVSLHRSQVAVRIGRADRETITDNIATNGKIEALNNFEAYAPAATTVKKIYVQQSSWVKPGQLLLQLEDANARSQAARAQAQLKGEEADSNAVENGGTKDELLTTRNALVKAQADRDAAQRNLQAMQRLLQSGAASQAEVDTAQSRFQIAEANVQLLQQKLSGRYSQQEVGHVESQQAEARASLAAAQELLRNSNIAAPRAGMVYSLPVRQGAFVNLGDLLVQVADLHQVRVRAFVDEPEIGKLRGPAPGASTRIRRRTGDRQTAKGPNGGSHVGRHPGAGLARHAGNPAYDGGAARDANGRRSDLCGRERRSQAVA